jgi:hypothetical protein
MKKRFVVALLGLGLPLTGMAEIYKWTDANGQVHFGQTPPPQGQFERVRPAESGGLDPGLSKFVEESDKANAAADKAHQTELKSKADKAEQCAKARERVSVMEQKGSHKMFMPSTDGTDPARMTDEEFQKRLDEAKKAETSSCG